MDSKVSKIPAEVGWKTFNSLCTSCLVMYICQFIAVTCQLQHVHLRAYRWGAFGSKKNRKLESDVMFVSATTRKWTGRRCRFVLAQFVETRQLVPNWEDSWKIMQFQYGPIIYNCIAGVHKVEAQVFHNDVQSCDFKWPVTDLELQSLSDQLWLLAATIRSAVGNPFRELPTRRTLKVKVPVLL